MTKSIFMDPNFSQQQAGLQNADFQLQQKVTRPIARYKIYGSVKFSSAGHNWGTL